MSEELVERLSPTAALGMVDNRSMLLSDDELRRSWRVAQALAASGMFKDARQAEQALAKILLGRDLGLSPTQAMTGIHIVEGKPMVSATTLASFVQRTPGYDYRVKKLDEQECVIEFFFEAELLGVSSFSMDDANKAGLVRQNSPWVKYPRNMLFARALSNGVRWYASAATQGVPIYYEGELVEDQPSLTAAGESMPEADYGEDEQVAAALKEAFGLLGYREAKVRVVLRACTSHEERVSLLASLNEQLGQTAPSVTDADVVA